MKDNKKRKTGLFNLANRITMIRTALIPVFIAALIVDSRTLNLAAIPLCIIIFYLDNLDGHVARRYDLKTKFGSYLDVVGDRITEVTFWITFLYLGIVPLWAPLIVFSRGMIVDTIRSQALAKNKGTYDMIETTLGKILVSSRITRGIYGGSKVLLFTLLTASRTIYTQEILAFTPYLTTFVVVMCVLRAIPVIQEGFRYIR